MSNPESAVKRSGWIWTALINSKPRNLSFFPMTSRSTNTAFTNLGEAARVFTKGCSGALGTGGGGGIVFEGKTPLSMAHLMQNSWSGTTTPTNSD